MRLIFEILMQIKERWLNTVSQLLTNSVYYFHICTLKGVLRASLLQHLFPVHRSEHAPDQRLCGQGITAVVFVSGAHQCVRVDVQ